MRVVVAVIIFSITLITQVSLAQTNAHKTKIDQLQQRLRDLEMQQKKMEDWYSNFYLLGKERVSPFLNHKISFGGYFESGIVNINGPDTENQTSANMHALGLNLTADFSEKFRFVTQTLTLITMPLLNTHNNSNLSPAQRKFTDIIYGTFLLQGYLEYSHSEFFNVQSGLGYVPFGISFSQREPFLFHQRGGPQMIYNDGFNVNVATVLWEGLHFYGLMPFFETNTVGYHLYSMTPGSSVGTLGFGGRLWWSINEYVKAGTSFQHGKKLQGSYFAQGFDLDVKYNQLGFLGEYATVVNSGEALDAESYYIEPYYKFFEDHWLVYISAEYLRSLDRYDVFTQIPDPFEKLVGGFGVNWLPIPTTRYRLGYLRHNYLNENDTINRQEKNYDAIDLSAAIAF
ncbi:MAG: hypothetical protein V4654_14955 [Bdellovibrionota bacterium]